MKNIALPNRPIHLLPLLITTGLLFFAFAVLVVGIDRMHMRPDEELTFRNMSFSFEASMQRLFTRNNQAPLWWMQVWAWQRLGGMTEFSGRVNSILWSLLTLSVVYQMGRRWFGERRFGWFAVAILSVNSYFFIYALEMRMYALGMFVVTLSMQQFERWLRVRTWQSAVWYGLSATLMLYTHYYFAFVVIAQVVFFVGFAIQQTLHDKHRLWTIIKQGLIVAMSAIVIWLPGIFILIGQLSFIDFADSGGLKIPTKETNLRTIHELAQISTNGWWWLYSGIIVIGVLLMWKRRAYWLALTWLLISPALVFIVNLEITIYNVRYTSFFIPAIGLAVGFALASLPVTKVGRWLNWIVLAVVCGISLYNLPAFIPDRIPYRHIYGDINANYDVGDVLYALPTYEDIYLEDQYDRYLLPELVTSRVLDREDAIENRRIWFITPLFLLELAQTEFRALESTHRVMYVAEGSECNNDYCYIAQLMVAPPFDEPIIFGDEIGFLGADIDPIIDNQLPVLLWWSVDAPPSADYSISLQLLRQDGSLVAQVDRQIDPPSDEFGEIPTSQMQAGGNYIDERIVDLPSDLPNGNYILQVVVYQWWDGVRLTTDSGSDAFEIETITINR